MEKMQNLYEVRKSLRFELKPISEKKDFFTQVEFNNEK